MFKVASLSRDGCRISIHHFCLIDIGKKERRVSKATCISVESIFFWRPFSAAFANNVYLNLIGQLYLKGMFGNVACLLQSLTVEVSLSEDKGRKGVGCASSSFYGSRCGSAAFSAWAHRQIGGEEQGTILVSATQEQFT